MGLSWRLGGTVNVAGARFPTPIACLLGLTLGLTLASVFWTPLPGLLALMPARVWQGEVWRLVTWVVVEPDLLSLVFAGLTLYWFGREFVGLWGPARFFVACAGVAAAAGTLVCLVARFVWPSPFFSARLTLWPLIEALLIAWGLRYGERRMRLFFMAEISGRASVWLLILATALYGAVNGFAVVLPHLAAQLVMLVAVRGIGLRRLWLRVRLALYERELRRRARHLRVVERRDDRPRWTH